MPTYRRTTARRRYQWPELQLNIWLITVLAGSGTCLGIFAWFMVVQSQLHLGTPWYVSPISKGWTLRLTNDDNRLFPFMTVCGALGVAFCLIILILAAQRFLLPGIIIIGSFLLFTLWLTGLIETGLQLYGAQANVNSNCQNYVSNLPYEGNTIEALAWLTQNNICKLDFTLIREFLGCWWFLFIGNCWKAAFAFELVNTVFYFWMMVMSWQVHRDANWSINWFRCECRLGVMMCLRWAWYGVNRGEAGVLYLFVHGRMCITMTVWFMFVYLSIYHWSYIQCSLYVGWSLIFLARSTPDDGPEHFLDKAICC